MKETLKLKMMKTKKTNNRRLPHSLVEFYDNHDAFVKMLNDEYPIDPSGTLKSSLYANKSKKSSNYRSRLRKICISIIPQLHNHFPKYPLMLRFMHFAQNSLVANKDFCNEVFMFIKNNWTEQSHPKRIEERLSVIRELIGHCDITYEWIVETSKEGLKRNDWMEHDVKYEFYPRQAMLKLCSIKRENFVDGLILRLPEYIDDFPKEEIFEFFEIWKTDMSPSEIKEVEDWLELLCKDKEARILS